MESLSAIVLDVTTPSMSNGKGGALTKESLTVTQMLLLNAVVCGVEICACAGFTYIPPMLLKAGYSQENMGFLLGLGPLLGFLLVPVIGRASDRCYSQFGRRRPFILGLAILLVVSLYMIPFGEYFAGLLVGFNPLSKRIGVWGLAGGVVLLDFTTQACLTPCEALLNDASKDSEQNEKIFTIYSLMISSGGIIGYLLTAIDWTSNPLGEYFGGQEASIFSILIVTFTMMLAATLLVAQEVPLSNSAVPVDIATVDLSSGTLDQALAAPKLPHATHESGYESSGNSGDEDWGSVESFRSLDFQGSPVLRPKFYSKFRSRTFRQIKRCLSPVVRLLPLRHQYVTNTWGCVRWLGRQLLPRQLVQLFKIPAVLRVLALADFCCWTAIMGFNIYYTDYVGQIVYGGNPNAPELSPEGRAYDEGVRIASWGLLLHCICSAVCSFFIERLTKVYGYATTFSMGMVTFVLAMMGMVLVHHIVFVNLMAAVTGIAYAMITTIPFMLVSKYHANKKVYFMDLPPALQSDSERGIGTDMAVLDWSYFLSQVVLTAAMGTLVHVTGTLVSYMVTAGVMGILALYFIKNIVENEVQAKQCIAGR